MKSCSLVLCVAGLLAGCNQTAPVTSAPTATAPAASSAVDSSTADSSATASPAAPTAVAPSADKTATPNAPALPTNETLKASFAFKPVPNPADPAHPQTSVHLLIQGSKPLNVDLGKFAGRPDLVDATKAKLAGFPSGMLLGFRSYQASSGISSDLAVLQVKGRYLRIVQRRVDEAAAEPGTFETARELPLPANTTVVAAPLAQK
ncbi:hypothetical protein IC235_01530 [Hymenobacter sp. BT664]|uniref:Uncharacterized protein n=1 Tax=Hymenobacter montanus TaxID=2771359 RepID=A0A927GHQ6_9BACT|nr:hypothetical protein [Hymenobacter montanus]MBD2766570.1 hypothetical protein [Hymenobacter montanus]